MDSCCIRASHGVGTARSAADTFTSPERDLVQLLRQKDVLLREMQHRMGNSLQILASILLQKARTVASEEARLHLRDAHGRIMSIAAIQKRLQVSESGERVELGSYLSDLCENLEETLVDGLRPVSLVVDAGRGMVCAEEAVSIGLIVTELVINALKHAFVADDANCRINVTYEVGRAGWRLAVRDNGRGIPSRDAGEKMAGLGTTIVQALACQMDARVQVSANAQGFNVTIAQDGFA